MKKILVVDDDQQMRLDLTEILSMEGYDVDSAGSGEEALKFIQRNGYDIVISDLKMPGMNGLELLARIKELKTDTRVIMITAYATIESAVEAMRRGASDYISKPFKINEIEVAVRRALEEAKFRENLRKAPESQAKLQIQPMIESISSPIRRGVIEHLLSVNSSSFMHLVEKLEVEDHEKLSFHLRKLRKAGIVTQDRERRYMLTSKGREVAQILEGLKGGLE
jgi:DNA-binding NtrC family response regulator